MNLTKINHYAKYSQESSRVNAHNRNYQLFVPHTPELYQMKAIFTKSTTSKNNPIYIIQLDNICRWSAGTMFQVGANWWQHHRSFVLGMLKGGLNLSLCTKHSDNDKNYQDAKRLSNLGGSVVLIKNNGNASVWGVVR